MAARDVCSRSGGRLSAGRDLSYQLVRDRRGSTGRGLVWAAVAGALVAAVVLVPLTVWLTVLLLEFPAPAAPAAPAAPSSSAVAGVDGSPVGGVSRAGFWFVDTKGL